MNAPDARPVQSITPCGSSLPSRIHLPDVHFPAPDPSYLMRHVRPDEPVVPPGHSLTKSQELVMPSSNLYRILLAGITFIVMAAATAFEAQPALAQCCGIGISNSTKCTFRVTLTLASGERTLVVPPGGDSWTIPDCAKFRLSITDACGNEQSLPTVIGGCIRVYLGTGCCVSICKLSNCRWEATLIDCPPCL